MGNRESDADVSALERARRDYRPRLPPLLACDPSRVALDSGAPSGALGDADGIRQHFPHTFGRPRLRLVDGMGAARSEGLRVGVVLSGGQAPGGHNVISGLFDALGRIGPDSRLFGFLGGPRGIVTARQEELTAERIERYRNTGGFDLIGSGRDKIETADQLAASATTARELALDGLVVVGGDDSNTNAAVLAEYFLSNGVSTSVLGVPKTIDGDLKGGGIEASFGFDTATKVYAELIGNICRDARSSAKYWHFVKLMGRSASHVTLECALQTRPNLALIGEEVQASRSTLAELIERIAGVVRRRASAGKSFGVCLVPEGLLEFIPEMRGLIDELNALLSTGGAATGSGEFASQRADVEARLSTAGRAAFCGLPERIQRQLLLDRDAHGNVRVSQIDTELLITEQVGRLLAGAGAAGEFRVQPHFFGYEGRCAAPSNFDADYTYSLGHLAATLVAARQTGYLCAMGRLAGPPERWEPLAVPLTSLMHLEERKGRSTPVIGKALVQLDGAPFRRFAESRRRWEDDDLYRFPGAIQYFGPDEIAASTTATLQLERG